MVVTGASSEGRQEVHFTLRTTAPSDVDDAFIVAFNGLASMAVMRRLMRERKAAAALRAKVMATTGGQQARPCLWSEPVTGRSNEAPAPASRGFLCGVGRALC